MDNTQEPPTVLSFCSGYGGIELGLERVFGRITTLAHVEIEAYAIANLISKMEAGKMAPAPIWTDVKTLPLEPFLGKVDILTGGYPCQPFSHAGRGLGEKDPRHLWPHIRGAIDIIRPRYCFFENVEGHIAEGLYNVLDDLGGLDYTSTWGLFSASEVGAPHRRNRIFILAHSNSDRLQRWEVGAPVSEGLERSEFHSSKEANNEMGGRIWDGSPMHLMGMANGDRDWMDRIRLCGNGVVPKTAELAWRTLSKEFE